MVASLWIYTVCLAQSLVYCVVYCTVVLQLRRQNRKIIFKRAEQYVKEYRLKERDEIRLKREARKNGNYYVLDEPRVAIVIRIKG